MNKLLLTCECGQDMVIPESALGRSGLCPGCGTEIVIRRDNTRPYHAPRRESSLLVRRQAAKPNRELRERSWRDFAAAVDLYNANRFAEAFAMLDGLLERFPGNTHVQNARDQCITALQESSTAMDIYKGKPVDGEALNPDLVESVILDKMRHSANEAIQLQAADMAARILGLYSNGHHHGANSGEPLGILPRADSPELAEKPGDALPPELPRKTSASEEFP